MLVSALVTWFVAHNLAARWVTPLPLLDASAKPLRISIAAGLIGHTLTPRPWIAAAVATVLILAGGLLFDRSLRRDLQRIIRSKNDQAALTDLAF